MAPGIPDAFWIRMSESTLRLTAKPATLLCQSPRGPKRGVVMKSRIAILLLAGLLACTVAPAQLGAQSQNKQEREDNVVLRVNEVVLDVVVRDKKGHAIKDLKSSDFEVYEDGLRQDISSFRLVSRERVGGDTKPVGDKT